MKDKYLEIIRSKSRSVPTFGLEHEVFICDYGSNELNYSDFKIQKLFKHLVKYFDWKVTGSINGRVKSLGKDNLNGTFNSIKMEFPCHLLELATGYFENKKDA